MLSDLRFRLRALANRRTMERELDAELQFHIEHEIEKYVRSGLSREEAARRARLAFGGVDRIKDDARDARGVAMIDSVLQDLRYAWRGLRSRPGFTGAVVLTLGLGIGANTAMFGIVDRLLFRPPAYLVAPERVHRVFVSYTWDASIRTERSLAYPRYADFARWTSAFDRMAAFGDRSLAIGTGTDAREMNVATVSASLFPFFDARPALGRFFGAAEDKVPNGAPVAVLGFNFWQTRYGASPDVLGKPIHIGERIYTIIGVAPEGFVGVSEESAPAAFVPITAFAYARSAAVASSRSSADAYSRQYGWTWLEIVARRKPGVSIAGANADLTAAYERSWEAERIVKTSIGPASKARPHAEATSLHMARGPDAAADSKVVTWVMGVAFIVLLVACANVANLLLARALKRRREIALRLALGVTRGRLIRQLFTESIVLATLGGLAGIGVAQWGGRAIRALFLRAEDAGAVVNDGRTLLFAGAVTLAVALLTGFAPAVQTLRGDVAAFLKAGAREGTYHRSRMRTALLLFQAALSVVLLVGAGLFVRSLSHVRALRLGYDVDPIVYVEGNARGMALSDAEVNALSERLVAVAAATPGVLSASLTVSVPFWSSEGRGAPFVPGVDSVRQMGRFALQAGSPRYFQTLGTRIVRGRGFTDDDRASTAPVVVVNEAMAKALWRGTDALGQIMRIGSDTNPFMTVVGIAEDMRGTRLSGSPEFWYYLPMAQYINRFGTSYPTLFVRVNGRAQEFVDVLRRRLQQEMPGASYVTAVPMRSLVAPRQRSWEFGATMFVAFGVLALVLAAIGLYSVIAYAVAQRTHELGVRIALGARVTDVVRIVVSQGIAFAIAGIAIGSVIAFWAGRWVEPLLFAQKARDPVIYASVAAVLVIVAVAATLRPAVRATRVDPTVALRAD